MTSEQHLQLFQFALSRGLRDSVEYIAVNKTGGGTVEVLFFAVLLGYSKQEFFV